MHWTKIAVLLLVGIFPGRAWTVDCTPADITLSTQSEVDNFQTNHGPCDRVTGLLTIDGAEIENVNGLSALTSVGDGLRFLIATSLNNVDGLSSLSSISGYLFFTDSDSLTQIDGLSNLVTVGGEVYFQFNNALTNLNGLSALTSAGALTLEFNTALQNVNGLSFLTDVELDVRLESNTALENVQGLSALTSVGGSLTVRDINGLTDLEGLHNISSLGGDLLIRYNPGLIGIDMTSLVSVAGDISIQNNDSLAHLDGLSGLISVGNNVLVAENPELAQCIGLTRLLDDIDDGDPGPGPGSGGIPDVGNQAFLNDNQAGCNSISEIMTIFRDGFESTTTNTITRINASPLGLHTFIAIGSDGYPIISFGDQTAGSLRLIKCDGIKCDGSNTTIATVDVQDQWVGQDSSIAIGEDGFPIIAHTGNVAEWGPLLIAKCNDLACSGEEVSNSVADQPDFHVGYGTSIAIGSDGFPVISHSTELEGVASLRVTKCNDPACTGDNETSTTLQVGIGGATSMAIGNDGFPIIGNYNRNLHQLIVAKCNDPACAGAGETITVVTEDILGDNLSLALGTDDYPVIAYQGNLGPALKVVKCNDLPCTDDDRVISVVDNLGEDPGSYPSIAIGANGNPIIAYWDRVGALGQVVVASCNDPACTDNDETITVVDGPSLVGQGISLAIGSDGLPIISYLDVGTDPDSIKVLHCGSANCIP
jgi:hypothetical protein